MTVEEANRYMDDLPVLARVNLEVFIYYSSPAVFYRLYEEYTAENDPVMAKAMEACKVLFEAREFK